MRALTVVAFLLVASAPSLAAELTEADVDEMASELQRIFAPDVERALGLRFGVDTLWAEDDLSHGGAWTSYPDGAAHVVIQGGLARHRLMTVDAVLTALCHELGHLIRPEVPIAFLTQIELESDLYATSTCLPKFRRELRATSAWTRAPVDTSELPASVSAACATRESPDTCVRSAIASLVVGRYLHWFFGSSDDYTRPSFDASAATSGDFPQCTLETYLSGALGTAKPRCYSRD